MESKNYYNGISKGYKKLYHNEQKQKIQKINFIIEKINQSSNLKILDLGCGDGILNDFIQNQNEIYSVDNSKNLLGLNKNKNKKLIDLNKEELPFSNNFFDYTFSFSVFQDLENFDLVFIQIRRVLKKEGFFILSFFKLSKKKEIIQENIKKYFGIQKIIEEDKDLIYILN